MDRNSDYFRQVQLLLQAIPHVAREDCFALKGGTAINLFHLPMPRLSVDIDLTYLPIEERALSLGNARAALQRIVSSMAASSPGLDANLQSGNSSELRAWVWRRGVRIKIELSPVFRGALVPPVELEAHELVQETFGYASMAVLQMPDLYGGKICAALDRQHPRDLFDVHMLLTGAELNREIFDAFLVYLIKGSRPIAEVLQPNLIDVTEAFESRFRGMTREPIELETLLEARVALLARIAELMTDADREFLLSVKRNEPRWDLTAFSEAHRLPAVQWKLENIGRMPKEKHRVAVSMLEQVLAEL